MQNTERDLKLYYSISEVAQMFDVNESLNKMSDIRRKL